MKDRRPRKLKKQLKRKFERIIASKIAASALIKANGLSQCAKIQAYSVDGNQIPIKARAIAETVVNTATAIGNIWKEKPTNWREC